MSTACGSRVQLGREDGLLIPLEKCMQTSCGERIRYSELTDDLNTHWHRRGVTFITIAEVRAQALKDAARTMRRVKDVGHWNLRDQRDPGISYSPDVWLEVMADREIEGGV